MGFVMGCARGGLGRLLLEMGLRTGAFVACTFLPGETEARLCWVQIASVSLWG